MWFPQYSMTSSTPALAKNSSVYSIRGVFASGSKHYHSINMAYDHLLWAQVLTRGRSSVKGENLVSKASANTTACRGSSLSSSPALPFCAPFFALGAMAKTEKSWQMHGWD